MDKRPFWWPDARGFAAIGVYALAAGVIIASACDPALMKEQLWVQIVTAIVITALIGVVLQFWFASSKGSEVKQASLDKALDAMTPKDPPA